MCTLKHTCQNTSTTLDLLPGSSKEHKIQDLNIMDPIWGCYHSVIDLPSPTKGKVKFQQIKM